MKKACTPYWRGRRILSFAVLLAAVICIAWFSWLHPWPALALLLLTPVILAPGLFPGIGIWIRRASPLPAAASDLPRRRPVWSVLSELYLDTELSENDYQRIAGVLIDSGYNTAQLEAILYGELHPQLHPNLLSVAGAWAGFDLAWLEARILQSRAKRSRLVIIPGKWMVKTEWATLKTRIIETSVRNPPR